MVCHPGSSRAVRKGPKRCRIFSASTAVLTSFALTSLLLSFGSANAVAAASSIPKQTAGPPSHSTEQLPNLQDPGIGRPTRFSRRTDLKFLNLAKLEVDDDHAVSSVALQYGRDDYRPSPSDSSQDDTAARSARKDMTSAIYEDNMVGRQTRDGYVFARRACLRPFVSVPRAAVANFLSRRDLRISHPPLVPNSNSRLLIGLILICIFALGILTITVQHLWSRIRAALQPASPLRRRSGDGRSSRSSLRADFQVVPLTPTDIGGVSSLEEEEEGIVTPPASLRRSSSAIGSVYSSPYEVDGVDSYPDSGRRSPHDLHYFSLPFGLGIGFSYSQISDRSAAEARVSTLSANRWSHGKRERSSSELVTSTSALPILVSTGVSGSEGLRSRARSFKDLCKDVIHTAVGGEASKVEDNIDDLSTASTSRWLPSLVAVETTGSESGSGATTPTAHNSSSILRPSISDIALDELSSTSTAASKGKARYYATGENANTSHTLVDLGHANSGSEAALSDPHEIARPASSPAAPLPSQIPRHPQVEQLRRQGRTETGKRVGKGTPTNTKVF